MRIRRADRLPPTTASQFAFARFATALAVVSVGALAVGALAIGTLAIRRLRLKDARIGRLQVDEVRYDGIEGEVLIGELSLEIAVSEHVRLESGQTPPNPVTVAVPFRAWRIAVDSAAQLRSIRSEHCR